MEPPMASTTENKDSPSKRRLDDSLLGFWKTKESSISNTSGAASVDSPNSSARSSSNYRNNKSQEEEQQQAESSISPTSGAAASADSTISSARSSSNYKNNKSQEEEQQQQAEEGADILDVSQQSSRSNTRLNVSQQSSSSSSARARAKAWEQQQSRSKQVSSLNSSSSSNDNSHSSIVKSLAARLDADVVNCRSTSSLSSSRKSPSRRVSMGLDGQENEKPSANPKEWIGEGGGAKVRSSNMSNEGLSNPNAENEHAGGAEDDDLNNTSMESFHSAAGAAASSSVSTSSGRSSQRKEKAENSPSFPRRNVSKKQVIVDLSKTPMLGFDMKNSFHRRASGSSSIISSHADSVSVKHSNVSNNSGNNHVSIVNSSLDESTDSSFDMAQRLDDLHEAAAQVQINGEEEADAMLGETAITHDSALSTSEKAEQQQQQQQTLLKSPAKGTAMRTAYYNTPKQTNKQQRRSSTTPSTIAETPSPSAKNFQISSEDSIETPSPSTKGCKVSFEDRVDASSSKESKVSFEDAVEFSFENKGDADDGDNEDPLSIAAVNSSFADRIKADLLKPPELDLTSIHSDGASMENGHVLNVRDYSAGSGGDALNVSQDSGRSSNSGSVDYNRSADSERMLARILTAADEAVTKGQQEQVDAGTVFQEYDEGGGMQYCQSSEDQQQLRRGVGVDISPFTPARVYSEETGTYVHSNMDTPGKRRLTQQQLEQIARGMTPLRSNQQTPQLAAAPNEKKKGDDLSRASRNSKRSKGSKRRSGSKKKARPLREQTFDSVSSASTEEDEDSFTTAEEEGQNFLFSAFLDLVGPLDGTDEYSSTDDCGSAGSSTTDTRATLNQLSLDASSSQHTNETSFPRFDGADTYHVTGAPKSKPHRNRARRSSSSKSRSRRTKNVSSLQAKLQEWWKSELINGAVRNDADRKMQASSKAERDDDDDDSPEMEPTVLNVEKLLDFDFQKALAGDHANLFSLNHQSKSGDSTFLTSDWLANVMQVAEVARGGLLCGTAAIDNKNTRTGTTSPIKEGDLNIGSAKMQEQMKAMYERLQEGVLVDHTADRPNEPQDTNFPLDLDGVPKETVVETSSSNLLPTEGPSPAASAPSELQTLRSMLPVSGPVPKSTNETTFKTHSTDLLPTEAPKSESPATSVPPELSTLRSILPIATHRVAKQTPEIVSPPSPCFKAPKAYQSPENSLLHSSAASSGSATSAKQYRSPENSLLHSSIATITSVASAKEPLVVVKGSPSPPNGELQVLETEISGDEHNLRERMQPSVAMENSREDSLEHFFHDRMQTSVAMENSGEGSSEHSPHERMQTLLVTEISGESEHSFYEPLQTSVDLQSARDLPSPSPVKEKQNQTKESATTDPSSFEDSGLQDFSWCEQDPADSEAPNTSSLNRSREASVHSERTKMGDLQPEKPVREKKRRFPRIRITALRGTQKYDQVSKSPPQPLQAVPVAAIQNANISKNGCSEKDLSRFGLECDLAEGPMLDSPKPKDARPIEVSENNLTHLGEECELGESIVEAEESWQDIVDAAPALIAAAAISESNLSKFGEECVLTPEQSKSDESFKKQDEEARNESTEIAEPPQLQSTSNTSVFDVQPEPWEEFDGDASKLFTPARRLEALSELGVVEERAQVLQEMPPPSSAHEILSEGAVIEGQVQTREEPSPPLSACKILSPSSACKILSGEVVEGLVQVQEELPSHPSAHKILSEGAVIEGQVQAPEKLSPPASACKILSGEVVKGPVQVQEEPPPPPSAHQIPTETMECSFITIVDDNELPTDWDFSSCMISEGQQARQPKLGAKSLLKKIGSLKFGSKNRRKSKSRMPDTKDKRRIVTRADSPAEPKELFASLLPANDKMKIVSLENTTTDESQPTLISLSESGKEPKEEQEHSSALQSPLHAPLSEPFVADASSSPATITDEQSISPSTELIEESKCEKKHISTQVSAAAELDPVGSSDNLVPFMKNQSAMPSETKITKILSPVPAVGEVADICLGSQDLVPFKEIESTPPTETQKTNKSSKPSFFQSEESNRKKKNIPPEVADATTKVAAMVEPIFSDNLEPFTKVQLAPRTKTKMTKAKISYKLPPPRTPYDPFAPDPTREAITLADFRSRSKKERHTSPLKRCTNDSFFDPNKSAEWEDFSTSSQAFNFWSAKNAQKETKESLSSLSDRLPKHDKSFAERKRVGVWVSSPDFGIHDHHLVEI